jgi:hypothetical protein
MNRLFWLVVVAAFIAGCGSPTAPDPAHNVDGQWDGSNSLDGFVHFVVVGGSAAGVVNVSHFSLSYTIQNPIGQTTPCSSSWILGNQLTTTLAHVTNGGAAFHAGQPGFRFATNGDGLPIPFEGFETVIAIFTGGLYQRETGERYRVRVEWTIVSRGLVQSRHIKFTSFAITLLYMASDTAVRT